MAIGTALLWGNVPTMALAITLAFLFGYSFTLFAVRRAGLDLKSAIKVALAADTVSIAVMELVDNGIIALTPGAMDAHLSDGLFWSALLGGFAVAFLVTIPVNNLPGHRPREQVDDRPRQGSRDRPRPSLRNVPYGRRASTRRPYGHVTSRPRPPPRRGRRT